MKKYTFTINKKNYDTTNNVDYSKIIDNIISNNIIKANPYFINGETDDNYNYIVINEQKPKNKKINIDIKINRNKYNTEYDGIKKCIEYFYSLNPFKKDYDFKLPDGTPVKMFDDEIQIGYDLIPLNNFTKSVYDELSEMCKKKIIDITINIARKNNPATILIA